MDKRAKEGRDGGLPYEEAPFETGINNGNSEPDVK